MNELDWSSQVLSETRTVGSPQQFAANAPSPRLVTAAHEFESAMMKELIAPLEPGHDPLGSEAEENASSSALNSYAGEALGKAISERGGFGIAKSILHKLSVLSNHSGNTPVLSSPGLLPPNRHSND